MRTATLDVPTLETLVSAAVAAPSIHNTQPWRFRLDPDTVTLEIRAAADRGLRHTDPTGRALHLSVGCALLNLRVAVAHFGWEPVTRLLPRPDEPDLLATVRLAGTARTSVPPRLYDALWRRHSSRFPFSRRPLPAALRTELAEAAHAEGALLSRPSPGETDRLLRITREAEHRNTADPDRAAESRRWTHEPDRTDLGMPPETLGPQDFRERIPMRDFGAHRHPAVPAARPFEKRPTIAVLSTAHDRRSDWLRAGQALERVLLGATAHGLRASLLHQALEWPDLREQLAPLPRDRRGHAQMVIRLGTARRGRPPRVARRGGPSSTALLQSPAETVGTRHTNWVPPSGRSPRVSTPPSARARSSMFLSPLRSTPPGTPQPSSVTVSANSPPAHRRWTSTERAPECRAALLSASPSTASAWSATAPGTSVSTRPSIRSAGVKPNDVAEAFTAADARPRRPAVLLGPAVGTQSEDGGANDLDGVVEVVDGPRQPLHGLGVVDETLGALQGHAGREQPLDRQVVQIAGDPVTVLEQGDLLRVPAPLGQLQRQRRLTGEPEQGPGVGVAERRTARQSPQQQHPARLPARAERYRDHGAEPGPVRLALAGTDVVLDVGADHRLGRGERGRDEAVLRGQHQPAAPGRVRADRERRPQLLRSGHVLRDHPDVRGGDLPGLLDDQFQYLGARRAGQQRAGDLRAGPQPALPQPGLLVQPRVLDGHPGGHGEGGEHGLVLGVELRRRRASR